MRRCVRSGMRGVAAAGVLLLAALPSCSKGRQPPTPDSPEWKIRDALHAAPEAVTRGARVMGWPVGFDPVPPQLRAGSTAWTCLPDEPATPGIDPVCMDSVFTASAAALAARRPPAIASVGVAYRLQGGTYASATQPFRTEPTAGQPWVTTGPHLEIVLPDLRALAGISTDWKKGTPYVLWAKTPYARLIVPVGFADER